MEFEGSLARESIDGGYSEMHRTAGKEGRQLAGVGRGGEGGDVAG